jgi:hypothetical protein
MTSTIVRYLRANHSKHHMGRSYATSRCSCLQIGACCPKTQAFHVDRVIPRAYRFGKFGVPPVKRLRCMVGVLGICLISISPIELRADNPETAYNETESPVNFAPTPSITAVTITNRVAHVGRRTPISRRQRVVWNNGRTMCATTAKLGTHASNPRLNLFCTLRC